MTGRTYHRMYWSLNVYTYIAVHIYIYVYIYTHVQNASGNISQTMGLSPPIFRKKSETRSKAARHGDGIQINVYIYTHKHVKCMYMYRYIIYIYKYINNLVGYITSSMIRLCTQRWERYRRTLTFSGFIWVCVMHFFVRSTKSQRSKSPSN
jgi:hypothetical protein